jgi:hypothetical protein
MGRSGRLGKSWSAEIFVSNTLAQRIIEFSHLLKGSEVEAQNMCEKFNECLIKKMEYEELQIKNALSLLDFNFSDDEDVVTNISEYITDVKIKDEPTIKEKEKEKEIALDWTTMDDDMIAPIVKTKIDRPIDKIEKHIDKNDVDKNDKPIEKIEKNVDKNNVDKIDKPMGQFDGSVKRFDGPIKRFDGPIKRFDETYKFDKKDKFDKPIRKFDEPIKRFDEKDKFDRPIKRFDEKDKFDKPIKKFDETPKKYDEQIDKPLPKKILSWRKE